MRIASTAMVMQSAHRATVRSEQSQSVQVWIDRRPTSTSTSAAASTPADPGKSEAQDEDLDPRLQILKSMIERLTGRHIKLIHVVHADAAPSAATPTVSGNAGFGVEYEYHAAREETEQTDFAAAGRVTTADGRQIDFALELEMSRSYSEQTDVRVTAGPPRAKTDPLVLSFDGSAAQLSTERTSFDLDADGQKEAVPLLSGNSAYLALDLNQNGKVDSGAELFGPATGEGFAELAKYDADGNGWIDENDPVFRQLQLWKPTGDGNGQLSSLQSRDVGALFLGHQATSFQLRSASNDDLGSVRSSGVYLTESGGAGSIQQIDLTA
jgi:hypothetical protein